MRLELAIALLLARAGPTLALTPSAERSLDEGLMQLYNLDYEQARSKFRRLIAEEPANPYGYLFEAGAIWWQASNEYALFEDTPTLEGLFEEDVGEAIRASKAWIQSSDPLVRAEGYFAEGMAYGARGQWHLLRGRWIKAYFDGKRGVKQLYRCLKADPELYDAYLGLGVYDYQAARLPGILKLGALIGVRGDLLRGIERLQLAVEKGRFGSRQAAQFLLGIYLVDLKDTQRAQPLLERLRASYPASPYFHFLEVATRYLLEDFDGSLRQARLLFEKTRSDPTLLGRKRLSLFCGINASACLSPEQLPWLTEWFDRALSAKPAPRGAWLTFLRLYRGIMRDASGQREPALEDYRQALANPDWAGMHENARRCVETACTREEILAEWKKASLGLPPAVAGTRRPGPKTN